MALGLRVYGLGLRALGKKSLGASTWDNLRTVGGIAVGTHTFSM